MGDKLGVLLKYYLEFYGVKLDRPENDLVTLQEFMTLNQLPLRNIFNQAFAQSYSGGDMLVRERKFNFIREKIFEDLKNLPVEFQVLAKRLHRSEFGTDLKDANQIWDIQGDENWHKLLDTLDFSLIKEVKISNVIQYQISLKLAKQKR